MTTIKKLEALGLTHWIKGGSDRIYVNDHRYFKDIFGLELDFYRSGNIKSAYLHGEKLSNSKAQNCFCGRPYYDCKAGKWCNTNLEAVI